MQAAISSTGPEPVICARRLVKTFRERVAVDDIELAIQPGICFGFLGPNGAGKTTTLRMAGIPYTAFLASGIIASSAMNTASFEGMYSVFTRMVPQKTYEAILATPIEVDDIMAGEMLWCATKALISGTAILIVSAVLGAVHCWQSLLVLPVVFLIGLCFAGPVLIMSALAESYDFFSYYFVLFITPMFILCGVFYPVDTLPQAIHNLVRFLPLTHGVYLTRSLVAGKELAQPWLHVAILLAYTAASYWIAVILVRRKLLV
jgi:lipooligosaccharide transport system permease protein